MAGSTLGRGFAVGRKAGGTAMMILISSQRRGLAFGKGELMILCF
jgi:hypothetical protein